MKNFDRVTFFTKFDVYYIFPGPSRANLPCVFFNWQHLYTTSWFSWHMLSDTKSLPGNFSWRRSLDLFRRFFLSTNTLRLCFPHLNFTTTISFFFKQWQACKSPGLTSCLVKESVLQMFNSKNFLEIAFFSSFTTS